MIVAAAASKARRGIKSERIEERKRERLGRGIRSDDDLNSFLFVRNDRRREGEIGDKGGASERVLLIIMRFGKMLFGGIAAVIRAAAAVSRLVILAGECAGLG